MARKKIVISPRISVEAKEWLGENFKNTNFGVVYVVESWPDLFRWTLLELGGMFTWSELYMILDAHEGIELSPTGNSIRHVIENRINKVALNRLDKTRGLDEKGLLSKIDKLTSFQKVVLQVWAVRFWDSRNNKTVKEYTKPLLKGLDLF